MRVPSTGTILDHSMSLCTANLQQYIWASIFHDLTYCKGTTSPCWKMIMNCSFKILSRNRLPDLAAVAMDSPEGWFSSFGKMTQKYWNYSFHLANFFKWHVFSLLYLYIFQLERIKYSPNVLKTVQQTCSFPLLGSSEADANCSIIGDSSLACYCQSCQVGHFFDQPSKMLPCKLFQKYWSLFQHYCSWLLLASLALICIFIGWLYQTQGNSGISVLMSRTDSYGDWA